MLYIYTGFLSYTLAIIYIFILFYFLKCQSFGEVLVCNPSNISLTLSGVEPTIAPSFTPSFAPSFTPSFAPSFTPSSIPSFTPSFNHLHVTIDYQEALLTSFGLFQPKYIQRLLDKIEQIETINDVQKLNDGVLALAYRIQNEVDNYGKGLAAEITYNLDLTQHYFNMYIVKHLQGNITSATQVAQRLSELRSGILDSKYATDLNAFRNISRS